MSDAHICPTCGGSDTTYQAFSGGREMWCRHCEDNYPILADATNLPRAALLQTGHGRIALRAQMDQELAHLADDGNGQQDTP